MTWRRLGVALALASLACACGAAGAPSLGHRDRWVVAAAGVTIPIPRGWSVLALNGREVLARDAADDFADNVNVLVLPHDGASLETQRDKTKQALGRLGGVTVAHVAIESRAGRRVLAVEFHGRLPGREHEVHVRSLTYVRGAKLVVVTATVLESRWQEMQPAIAKLVDSVVIRGS